MARKMPRDKPLAVDDYLCETEVHTRMSQIIYNFRLLDLETLNWHASWEQLGIDEYEQTALLTSIEHEFHTVFEDRVFENFENLH